MNTGMLWFDDSPGALSDRVRRAVEYYADKFGRSPTLCLVNPAMLEKEGAVAGIQVRAARTVMVNHFFIGEERNGRANGDGKANGSSQSKARRSADASAKSAKPGGRAARKQAEDASA